MRLLDLPHGFQARIDEADWDLVKDLTLYRGTNGYVYYSKWESGRSLPRSLHSLILLAPKGTHVDHINGDKLDNRRSNLRIASYQQNQANRRALNRNNSSGIRGVAYAPQASASKPWRAQITADKRNHHLGLFATKEEAVAARKAAEIRFFGEECP